MNLRKPLIQSIAFPLIAYLPFLLGNLLPVWLNVSIFVTGLVTAMVLTTRWTLPTLPKRRISQVIGTAGVVLYAVIAIGLVDVVALASGVGPFIITGGEGWANLIAFVSWAIFIIPVCYIVGTTLLFLVRHFETKRKH